MTHFQPLIVRPHALSQQPELYHVTPGQTLLAMLLETTQGQPLADDVEVRIAGEVVPREWWPRLRPKPGVQILAYRTGALQGGAARQVLGIVAMIAISYFTLGAGTIAGFSLGTASAAGTMAVKTAAYMLGSLAVSALVRPPTRAAATGPDGQWHQLTGSANQSNPWGVIPFVISEARWFPPHAAAPYSETVGEKNYMYYLFELGHGDIEVLGVPTYEGTPLTAFQGVQWAVTRTPTLYVRTVSEQQVGATIEHDDSVPYLRTTAPDTTSISMDLIYAQAHFGTGTSGKDFSMWTAWRIRYRPVGTSAWLEPVAPRRSGLSPNKPAKAPAIAGANYWAESLKKKPFGVSLAWDVPAGQYEVEVTRMGSLRGSSDNAYYDAATWTVLRSIKSGNPSRTGTTKLELRIQVNNQINGVLQSLQVHQRQLIPVWDRDTGTWSAPQPTNNPGHVVPWLMTRCPAVPERVPDSRLDLDEWANYAEWCAEHGLSVHGVCDSPQPTGDLIDDILANALAELGERDGCYVPIHDPGDVQETFTFDPPADFRMERGFVEVPHALRVQFVNPDADWQQDEVIVLDDGYSHRGLDARGQPSTAPAPELFETLQLRYAASAQQAWQLGRFHLAQGKFRQATYTWSSDIAGLGTTRGDVVDVPNDVLEWGEGFARVVQLQAHEDGTATVVLDNMIPTEAGRRYRLKVRRANGTGVSADLAAAGGDTHVFRLKTVPAGVRPGDLATVVHVDQELQRVLVTDVKYGADLRCNFTAVAYDERVGPYWQDPPETIISEITGRQYGVPDAPIIDGVVGGIDHSDVDDAGILAPVIHIGVRQPSYHMELQ